MAADGDLAASLPEPPPPRPDRRDAAIAAAMRRFDGAGQGAVESGQRTPAKPPPWWKTSGRPQLAAFATAALVIAIGLPVWMASDHPFTSGSREAPQRDAREVAVPGSTKQQAAPSPAPITADMAAPAAAPESPPALWAPPAEQAPLFDADAPPPPPSARKSDRTEAREDRVADIAAPPAPPPPAMIAAAPKVAPAPAMSAEASGDSDIVVTGTKISPRTGFASRQRAAQAVAPGGRGDWNACTVNDPTHSLSTCKAMVDPAVAGRTGLAAAQVADGLSRGWQGDADGAIAAFDRAIAISPRLSFAYLNRGLAYAQQRKFARALADLDRAVRYAPKEARGYYNRSLVRRQRGDGDGAQADEERAVALDRHYEELVE